MSIHKTAGTKMYMSPTSIITDDINAMTDNDAITAFEAINDWVEIGEIEDYGEIGDAAAAINFTAVGNRRVRKLKGPRDAGTQNLVVGRDPLDDGQDELIAAEGDDFNYSFKIELADQPSASYGPSVMYYGGLVMSRPTNIGNVSAVTRRTFMIGINTALYEVAAPALAVPVNVFRPSIYGTSLAQAAVLTADEGQWTNHPTSYTYQWQSDTAGNGTFADISGATARTHTIAAGQAGDAIRVQVTAHNAAGASAEVDSLSVGLAGA